MTESSGLTTPPMMVQTVVVLRAAIARIEGRSDAEHDIDVPAVNLNALDQKADQIPLQRPVDGCHPVTNLPGEILKPAHDQRQCRALRRLVPQGRSLLLPGLDPLTQPGDAWLEVGLVDQTLGITVDQPAHPAAQLGDLGLDAGQITCCLIDQRRDWHADPLAWRHVVDPMGPAGLFAAAAHRAQPGRHRSDPGLAEGRRSSIGGVPENAPHGGPIPGRLAAAGPDALLLETPAHLADAEALAADQRKDPPHDPSLVLQDLVAGHAAVSLADIAIAVGRA